MAFTYSMADLIQPKETKMTLYFQDYSGGPNATVVEITGQPDGLLRFTKFGAMFCTDDPITEGFDESSPQIARAQGLYVTSALDGSNTHVLISIVFTNEEYKGSTLETQGTSAQFEQVREVAVVGGTGKFRLARGYVTFETIHYDHTLHYAVIQCNVTVLHY
ncbi:Dirigent protein 23 [Sesamum alatum]|uniref:Dirigent protein n=1 Tax=Sesamum alatum TaxID=300844 RepID=A0AAE1XZN6_9LAMI|nr:Dirigent protein 23 [Sesamum alatum]